MTTDFQGAILSGTTDDGGLFVPENFPKFSDVEIAEFSEMEFPKVAEKIAQKFIGDEIPPEEIKKISRESYNFPIPIVDIFGEDDKFLELFHGPTAAFKDFAARFLARCVGHFLSKNRETKTVLVATSGDTGGAVGAGFFGVEGVQVVILYPRGGVSKIQEKQLTTIGKNVRAFEVNGSFDDCQRLVKSAFASQKLRKKFSLMSANSINIGRVISQSFYFFWTASRLSKKFPGKKIVFSVPSGNFGNLTGGLLAQKIGAPIHKFVATNNSNHPFFDFLKTGKFKPKKSVATISNAMDIGNPNNFWRIFNFFDENIDLIREKIFGAWFDDDATRRGIREIFQKTGIVVCPHTAVGWLGLREFRKKSNDNFIGVSVATAHPAKFPNVVEPIVGKIEAPENLREILQKIGEKTAISADLDSLESAIQNF